MLRKFLLRLKDKHFEAMREQKGQSIIIFTFAFLALVAMLGLALDLGLVYIERVKVGRTTDAATLAGVTELSNNDEVATIARAVEYIRLNGYDVGGDTEVLVRGCTATGNVNEAGSYTSSSNPPVPMAKSTTITGSLYIPATKPRRATFMIDTGSYHANPTSCKPTANPPVYGGNAQKIQVAGKVFVHMSFMQFFGFRDVPVQDEAIAENLTTLDIVVVFDISGSMEDQTRCIDCWVRTTYGITSTPYPSNGYFNPIPFAPSLAPSAPNQTIPDSRLCTDVPTPWVQSGFKYLTAEAELYSANIGNWDLDVRTAGQGFWAVQRGSRGSTFPPGIDSTDENGEQQGNRAGDPNYQSSNVCNPALPGQINCKIGASNDDVCSSADSGIVQDCSAYISTRPFQSYGQPPGSIPNPNGATYNLDCFLPGTGPFTPTVLSGQCWSNVRTGNENPFFSQTGPGPSNPLPWVEYDFTPTWTQTTTSIWIRASGSGANAFTWAGGSPDDLDGTPNNNLSAWNDVVFWQINNGQVNEQNGGVQTWSDWRDTRAEPGNWRWIRLGSTPTVSGTLYTLKLYQGSPGYKVDKIIFTNDLTTGTPPAAMRRQLDGTTAGSDGRTAFGPPVSYGSATREACNMCNPIYGRGVPATQCSCLKNNVEAKIRYSPSYTGYNPTFYGTGTGCNQDEQKTALTSVYVQTVTPPEVQPPQVQTRTLVNPLYSGMLPIRSAQEAVKSFILGKGVEEKYQLKPGFDQVGFVAFSPNVVNGTNGSGRAKLQCLRTMNPTPTDAATCYGKVLSVVEKQWPNWGTNISEGMREGLEELGLSVGSNTNVDSTCTSGFDDKHACDRGGAARRVLILMTDGSPNAMVNNCSSQTGYADYWDGLVGNGNPNFECAMWYAQQAAEEGVIVYTIGIGGGANDDLLETMATGVDPHGGTPQDAFPGGTGRYFKAAQPSDLDGIFKIILTSVSVRIIG